MISGIKKVLLYMVSLSSIRVTSHLRRLLPEILLCEVERELD